MTSPVISLSGVDLSLTSRAGSVNILRSVSLTVDEGESVAIVGPSGSGKTSLLMIMAGLEQPTCGTVDVTGHAFHAMDEDALAKARGANIGIVFQSFHLVPTMTALENVALPLEFAGHDAAAIEALERLKDVDLEKRADHFPAQLSGGEQQRVALARALAPSPELILADEPTGNLDGETGRHVTKLLFGLQKKKSATLVLVTHDEKLAALCDRVIRMSDGRIVADQRVAAA